MMKFHIVGIVLLASIARISCLAFQHTSTQIQRQRMSTKLTINVGSTYKYTRDASPYPNCKIFSPRTQMNMGTDFDGEEDEDEDDDDYIDDEELGDWRSFRNSLVGSGISSEASDEGYISPEDAGAISSDGSDDDTLKEEGKERPKSVSKANEELLKSQSEELAKEYLDGAWAHEASMAEVGGLVVRLPLEVEIYRCKDRLTIGKELQKRLETDDDKNSPLLSDSNNDDGNDSKKTDELSFSIIAVKTLLWFRKAQRLIQEQMGEIASFANENGEINPRQLDSKSENLLKLYLDNQETWQAVCVVAKKDELNGSATTYAINRPMAFQLTENLARLLLFGAPQAMADSKVPVSQLNRYSKFLRAFEKSCAVYVGGPDGQSKEAVMIHGIADLEGAEEIAPGTGIYIGGIDAAVAGVLKGTFKPLDFRFFVGHHNYKDGDLDVAIYSNKYQPIACARSLALKQCIQLPKPLWHEVMELCGGELREVSRLELMKRSDIQDD